MSKRLLSTACLTVWMLTMAIIAGGCEDKLKPAVSSVVNQDLPSQESWNSKIVFSDSGRTKAILRAGHIMMFSEQRYTLLDSNVVVDFYDPQEHHTSVLTARRGRVDDNTKNLEAFEHVVVRSDSGTTMTTEHLYWDNARQLIHTPLYVEIVSPTEQIQGTGFESDQSLKHYTIQKVTGKATQVDHE